MVTQEQGGEDMKGEKAFEIAIKSIEQRQRQYLTGHQEYLRSGDPPRGFEYAKRDHGIWTRLEEAKKTLEREINVRQLNFEEVINAGKIRS